MVNKGKWFKLPAPEPLSPLWWLRWVPAVVLIILLLEFLYIVGKVAIVPVLASFALAYMLNPLVQKIERRGFSRPVATIMTISLMFTAIVLLLAFVLPDLLEHGVAAGEKIMAQLTPENARRQRVMMRRYSPVLDNFLGPRIEEIFRNPAQAIGSPALWAVGGLSGFFSTAVASLDLLLVPFFVYYILIDFKGWRVSQEELIPPRFRDTFRRLFDEVGRILETYVRGQLLIALIMAGLYAVGFWLLGVPAWAGIAALAGLLNVIPYVGTVLGLVVAGAFVAAEGNGLWRLGGLVGVFTLVQTMEGYWLTPRIIGTRLSLHPMAVFLGLLIGGKLFGFLGIILAVPVIAISKVFWMFIRELYRGSYFYHAGDIHPAEAPSEVLEERLAEAADQVLAEQADAQAGEPQALADSGPKDSLPAPAAH